MVSLFAPSARDNTARFVAAYLIFRTVAWTAVLFFTQPTLPLDVLEHLAWGREWAVIYAHHPGLPAWINESIAVIFGGSRLALSATAPVAVSIAMMFVWLLARRIADEKRAAIAALSCEGVYYFNVAATEFNHNVLQLAACAWLFFAAHNAFLSAPMRRSKAPWIMLGAASAVSLYAKYSSVLFLTVLLFWSIYEPAARRHWKTAGPALAFAVFAALNVPQIIALINLEFAPLQFALSRAEETQRWTDHIVYPLHFAAAQLAAAALGIILCFAGRGGRGACMSAQKPNLRFVAAAAFAPLMLALFISAVAGLKFKSMWGAAMPTFAPLFLLLAYPREVLMPRFKIALLFVSATAIFAAIAINIGGPFWNGRGKRIHYPAENISQTIAAEWKFRHPESPLVHVAGAKHIASLLSFYLPQRPSAIIDGNWRKSFWTSKEAFVRTGGIVAWVIEDGKRKRNAPPIFADQFPASDRAEFSFDWKTAAKIPPLKLGVIFIPPGEN